jgi:A/G-specific adenine glycosylase
MHFSKEIINWYHQNKRDLPWRETKNPYKIWLSEIILQQTRVAQGLSYYLKFVDAFPTVQDLAKANEETVLKLWQGLGYYSRARNLHFSAQQVVNKFKGRFPTNYDALITLKGVGDYTASAISSFCSGEPHAVVDGNVYRVLARHFGIEDAIDSTIGKKIFKNLATELLNKNQPGLHNQSIMEFGALQCVPKNPNCPNCPLSGSCVALTSSKVELLPKKDKKLKQVDRFFNYIVISKNQQTYLQQRKGKGIWENLYQFPLIETSIQISIDQLVQSKDWEDLFNNGAPNITVVYPEIKHVLSHQIIHARFIEVELESFSNTKYQPIVLDELNSYPVPILISNFIERCSSLILP